MFYQPPAPYRTFFRPLSPFMTPILPLFGLLFPTSDSTLQLFAQAIFYFYTPVRHYLFCKFYSATNAVLLNDTHTNFSARQHGHSSQTKPNGFHLQVGLHSADLDQCPVATPFDDRPMFRILQELPRRICYRASLSGGFLLPISTRTRRSPYTRDRPNIP